MLDLKKVGQKVDELIGKITKEDFEKWLIEDEIREVNAFLLHGHPVKFKSSLTRVLIKNKIKKPAHKAGSLFCNNNKFNLVA